MSPASLVVALLIADAALALIFWWLTRLEA